MIHKTLDVVALTHSIEENNLKEGDTGTIVEVYGKNEAYEVEFVNKNGRTKALITLNPSDITSHVNKAQVINWITTPRDYNDTNVASNPEESITEVFLFA